MCSNLSVRYKGIFNSLDIMQLWAMRKALKAEWKEAPIRCPLYGSGSFKEGDTCPKASPKSAFLLEWGKVLAPQLWAKRTGMQRDPDGLGAASA